MFQKVVPIKTKFVRELSTNGKLGAKILSLSEMFKKNRL